MSRNARAIIMLLAIATVLVANPLLHTWLTLQFADRPALPTPAGTTLLLYVAFAWLTALAVFVVETQRRRYLGGETQGRCALRLGVLGLAMPPIAMALHPDGMQLGVAAWATAISTGAALGSLEGLLYCRFGLHTKPQ